MAILILTSRQLGRLLNSLLLLFLADTGWTSLLSPLLLFHPAFALSLALLVGLTWSTSTEASRTAHWVTTLLISHNFQIIY